MRKNFFLFLCVILLCPLASCGNRQETSASTDLTPTPAPTLSASSAITTTDTEQTNGDITPSAQPDTIASTTLSITCSTKGFNPYLTTDTLVEQTANLIFENFIDISPDFAIEYRLAKQITSIENTIIITLRDDCFFADGTPITLADAEQSLRTAMASETYAARFANVVACTTTETELILTLTTPDSLFEYLLDIPILKEADLASTTPTANGRYTYGTKENTLTKNPYAAFVSDGADTINLVPVTNYDGAMSALALGQANYVVQNERATGNSTISTVEHYYKTNTLLFVGINALADNKLCNTPQGRNLLSALINRDEISTNTYHARSYTARGALNSFYPAAKDTQQILSIADDSTLTETMELLEFSFNTEQNIYQDAHGNPACVSILLDTATTSKMLLALEIAENWAKYGIKTEIVTAPDFNSFLTLLKSGEFELYIGEMKLYNNIGLSSFFEGSASYGIHPSETLLSSYAAFRADASKAAAFETAFVAEMPYIPLLWKNGVVLSSRTIGGVRASISNPFYAFGDLTFSD